MWKSCLFKVAWVAGVLCILRMEAVAGTSDCKRFDDVFQDGRELCENIFGDAFQYVPRSSFLEYELAYTMWFFSENNPNDATTVKRLLALRHDPFYANTNTCHLRSPGVTAHKEVPSAENSSTFTECYPFRSNACCAEQTVENTETIKKLYGETQRWDTCGPMSPQCERFFVQRSCFYECDPNAGLFRRYPPTMTSRPPEYQEWEISKLPIKGDYCDAWFSACREDLICAAGNVLECASSTVQGPPSGDSSPSSAISAGAIAGIVVASILLATTCLALGFVLWREQRGRPLLGSTAILDATPIEGRHGVAPQTVTPAIVGDTNRIHKESTGYKDSTGYVI